MMLRGIIWLFVTNAKLTAIVMVCVPLVVAHHPDIWRRVRDSSPSSQDKVAADQRSVRRRSAGTDQNRTGLRSSETDKGLFSDSVEDAFAVSKLRTIQRALLITIVIVLVLGAVGLMLWIGGIDLSRDQRGGAVGRFCIL